MHFFYEASQVSDRFVLNNIHIPYNIYIHVHTLDLHMNTRLYPFFGYVLYNIVLGKLHKNGSFMLYFWNEKYIPWEKVFLKVKYLKKRENPLLHAE